MAQTRIDRQADPAQVAAVLRERIYGGIACLSTLLVLVQHMDEGASPWTAFADVAIAAGGLWAASLLADYVAHMAAHGRGPRLAEAAESFRASGQILQASGVPLLLLVLAGLDVMRYGVALRAGVWTSIVSLGLFALLAARRTALPPWKRAVLVLTLLALGALVVAVKTLAHG